MMLAEFFHPQPTRSSAVYSDDGDYSIYRDLPPAFIYPHQPSAVIHHPSLLFSKNYERVPSVDVFVER
jgi:hypothetical protein